MRCLTRALALTLAAAPSLAQGQAARLELTLDQAVERALKGNLDIAVQRLEPEASSFRAEEARSRFDVVLSSLLSRSSRVETPSSLLVGGDRVASDSLGLSLGAGKALRSGGNVALALDHARLETNSLFATFSPAFDVGLGMTLRQPLLRNRRIDEARLGLLVARKNQEISEAVFRQKVLNTLAEVRELYWELALAAESLEAQRQGFLLAERLIAASRARFEAGTAARLGVVAAESERARRAEAVIVAESALMASEDRLKRALFTANDPETWALRIVAVDPLRVEAAVIDVEAAVREALADRTDLAAARRELEKAALALEHADDQTLPSVDLVAGYRLAGLGGTGIVRTQLGGPVLREVPGGYGDALRQLRKASFPTWNVALSVSYPMADRRAKAALSKAKLDLERARLSQQRLEMQVVAELRGAARDVETTGKRVAAARETRQLEEKHLEVEQARFDVGLSTSYQVAQSQRDLATARVAELAAMAAVHKSLARFDLLRQAGLDPDGRLSVSRAW